MALWIIVVVAVFASGGALVYLAWRYDRRQPGTPEPEILDDTEPLDPRDQLPCQHGVPVSQHCPRCDGAMRGRHVTIDDDEPKGAA